jgi:hypothetical protein
MAKRKLPAKPKQEAAAPRGRGRPRVDPLAKAERKRAADVARSRRRTAEGSEVDPIPDPENPERRAACAASLPLFLSTYFPFTTGLSPFSRDHEETIASMEQVVRESGRHVNAVYRGFAKSTISENTSIFAALNGYRRFTVVFAAESDLGKDSIKSIKLELSENDLLAADYPEVCLPIRALEGKTQRCHSQTYNGDPTYIQWNKDKIVLPTIPGSKASGAVIAARGITASILGLRQKTPAGQQVRPDLVIVDDPQTRESANQPAQVKKRLDILVRSILQLSGHTRKIACVVNGTVIAENDMIDQLLNPALFPSFQGRRIPMVKQWSDRHEDFWLGRYRDVRSRFSRDDPEQKRLAIQACNQLYLDHRNEADQGCRVSWDTCFDRDSEHSAIQHAYNILIDDGPEAFASEYQQQPLREADEDLSLSAPALRSQVVDDVPRWVVPAGLDTLTAFCDVQESSLWWLVCGWGPQLRGHVVAYGVFPEQPRAYITLREIKKTLQKQSGQSLEASVDWGLREVAATIMGREYQREDGQGSLRVQAMLVDANYAKLANVVRDFCRRNQWGTAIMPSHGTYVGATTRALNDRKAERGERTGPNWRTTTRERLRHLLFDTNAWKSLAASRLRLPRADLQAMTIHGGTHDCLLDHFSSEFAKRAASREKTVDEWKKHPGRDNHWWDCLIGAMVAASFVGISGVGAQPIRSRQPVKRWDEAALRKRREELALMAARAGQ